MQRVQILRWNQCLLKMCESIYISRIHVSRSMYVHGSVYIHPEPGEVGQHFHKTNFCIFCIHTSKQMLVHEYHRNWGWRWRPSLKLFPVCWRLIKSADRLSYGTTKSKRCLNIFSYSHFNHKWNFRADHNLKILTLKSILFRKSQWFLKWLL